VPNLASWRAIIAIAKEKQMKLTAGMRKTKLIVNLTRGNAICVGVLADRPLPRMRGLMGSPGLPAGEGLLLHPAPAIHTAFMRFPIDALFLDRDMRVVEIVERMRPWRMASQRHARSVLELAAGESARCGVLLGDRIGLRERRPVTAGEIASLPTHTPASQSIVWASSLREGGLAAPMRVLLISHDQQFRRATTMLLAHRSCAVTTTADAGRVAELVRRDEIDVVVIDSDGSRTAADTVTAIEELERPVGVVLVQEGLSESYFWPVLEKWGPFESLFAAIETAERERTRRGAHR
jgi:uncharacterized membrane protein (UPF0127 family)